MDWIQYSVEDGIAHLRLNRPDKLNALTDDMVLAFREHMFEIDENPDVKVAVVSGEGRAFCSGADVRQRQLRPREELERLGSPHARGASMSDAFFGFSHWKPVIGAVHGYVLGAGLALTLRCDLVVAAENAQFQITEIKRGLDVTRFWAFLYDLGAGQFANDVALTGRFWSAEEALRANMVCQVVPEGQQVEAAFAKARTILALPPLGVRALVKTRRFAIEELQARANARVTPGLHLSEDFHESALAFIEKRDPVFKGH